MLKDATLVFAQRHGLLFTQRYGLLFPCCLRIDFTSKTDISAFDIFFLSSLQCLLSLFLSPNSFFFPSSTLSLFFRRNYLSYKINVYKRVCPSVGPSRVVFYGGKCKNSRDTEFHRIVMKMAYIEELFLSSQASCNLP